MTKPKFKVIKVKVMTKKEQKEDLSIGLIGKIGKYAAERIDLQFLRGCIKRYGERWVLKEVNKSKIQKYGKKGKEKIKV